MGYLFNVLELNTVDVWYEKQRTPSRKYTYNILTVQRDRGCEKS